MARKTFSVEEFKNRANGWLALEGVHWVEKKTFCFVLEGILHDTGNYHGYSYIGGYTADPVKEYNRKYN